MGFLAVVAPPDPQGGEIARKIEGQMKVMARAETGAQPAFGAKIVEMILSDEGLRRVWEEDVCGMAEDLHARRLRLRELLKEKHTPGEWDFLAEQKGMFSYVMVPFLSSFLACLLSNILIDHISLQTWRYLEKPDQYAERGASYLSAGFGEDIHCVSHSTPHPSFPLDDMMGHW